MKTFINTHKFKADKRTVITRQVMQNYFLALDRLLHPHWRPRDKNV